MDVMSTKVLGVIQARMDSKRLPGKVLKKIENKPLIWHIYKRLQNITEISQVVIATTNEDSDKPLRDFLVENKISFYAGSVNNVLDRLYNTGNKFQCDILVKVNADCPLIDPDLVQEGIKKYLTSNKKIDLVTNCVKETFPEGMQYAIFNFNSIIKLWKTIKDPFWKEYFFRYFLEKENKLSVEGIESPINFSSFRWAVDYQEDFDFVKKIYEVLYQINPFFGMKEILNLLETQPEISEINKKISSKISFEEFNNAKRENRKIRYL